LGYKVALIERSDFGSGSSSRSSRIMHCGLNYLASVLDAPTLKEKVNNLRLARSMMKERALLRKAFPDRLVPKTFVIPVRASDSIKLWQYDVAFSTLRALGGYDVPLNYT